MIFSPLSNGRRFSSSYNSVPSPPDGIELAKQRAQEIVTKLFSDVEAKRPKTENGTRASVEKGEVADASNGCARCIRRHQRCRRLCRCPETRDWLIEVHQKFKLMLRRDLQLLGMSSMLIATKYEEISAPMVYVTIKTMSIAMAASALDSLLDLLAGGVLWFTHLSMKNINVYKYPIDMLRVQPVGIIIFAAIMATLGVKNEGVCML